MSIFALKDVSWFPKESPQSFPQNSSCLAFVFIGFTKSTSTKTSKLRNACHCELNTASRYERTSWKQGGVLEKSQEGGSKDLL